MLFTFLPRLTGRFLAIITALAMLLSTAPFYAPNILAATVTGEISVLPNPNNGVGDGNGEYFTVENTGTESLDMTGWEVTDTNASVYTFGSVVLAAGETFTVCVNDDSGLNGGIICDDEWSGGAKWNNGAGGDTLTLFDAEDNQQATITYTNPDDDELFSATFSFETVDPVAAIVAHKIVCTDVDEMPQGDMDTPIDADTAADWVAAHDSCDFAADFEFEWAPEGTTDPGDTLIGSAGAAWTTFGPTNSAGEASTTLLMSDFDDDTHVWMREVLQSGYELFVHDSVGNDTEARTSEFYCHSDAKNLDNFDRIDDIATDETYYCVAWNLTLEEEVPDPGLTITNPAADSETLAGEHTFAAEYIDADEIADHINWAIRNETCGGENFAGNVGGLSDTFDLTDGIFTTTVDMRSWENGEYCLVVNPNESGAGEDFRELRTFFLENDPVQCTVTVVSDTNDTVVEKEGAAAQLLSFVHPAWTAFIDGASWIWGDDPVVDVTIDETQTFVQEFVFTGPVVDATLYVAADNTYEATLNGDAAGADANDQNFRIDQQDEYDVASLIDQGVNTLSIAVTNLKGGSNASQNPAGLLYKLEVNGSDVMCDELPPEPATLEITDPETDDETLAGVHIFEAEYNDDDETEDAIKWAIRFETCDADDTATVAGNVGGFSDTSSFVGGVFSAEVDMSDWDDGEYCFVVNPQEQSGEDDLRATRPFFLENAEPLVCAPGVNLLANASFEEPEVTKKRGWDLVDPIGWMSEVVSGGAATKMELHRGVNGWTSADGEQHSELGTKVATILSQVVPTIEDASYTLSWEYSPRPGQPNSENEMDVLVDGEDVVRNSGSLPNGPTVWEYHSYEFDGTGDDVEVAFMDDGKSNGVGPFLDDVKLVCTPELAPGPYCGDGVVNGSWEQCELGEEGCTDHCLYENQCTMEQLVKITLEDTDSVSFDGKIYLVDEENIVPNGVWFNFNEVGDDSFVDIANAVDGLAVERDTENDLLALAFVGGNGRRNLDNVFGNVMSLGIDFGAIDPTPNPSFKLEDETFSKPDIVDRTDTQIDFKMFADTGNDAFTVAVGETEEYNCPECKAKVEARVVLQDADGNLGNVGDGNLGQAVFLGDGTEVAFGEWFEIFDGTDYVTDATPVESFSDPETLDGLFVSRTGDGEVKLAMFAMHEQGEEPSYEYIRGRLEFRDATVVADSLEALKGQYRLEDHADNEAQDRFGFDEIALHGDDTVLFDFWANTQKDGFKVRLDHDSIESCEDDDDEDDVYVIEGHKWNDLDADGYWDDGEPVIPGWTVYLDSYGDGDRDPISLSTTTDADGYYYFEVPAGWYEVSEGERRGWYQTAPGLPLFATRAIQDDSDEGDDWEPAPYYGSCEYHFGEEEHEHDGDQDDGDRPLIRELRPLPYNPEYCDFGNHYRQYTIDGVKWDDQNNNGEQDEGEPLLAGWTIQASDGEMLLSTTTDANGYYYFTVGSGEWTVNEVQQSGWAQTAPVDNGVCVASLGAISDDFESSNEVFECDFGNYEEPEDLGPLSCDFFDSNRSEANTGEVVTLAWNTSGAASVTIDNSIGSVGSDGSIQIELPNVESEIVYNLTATNNFEEEVSCSTTIRVTDSSGGSSNGGGISASPNQRVLGESISVEQCSIYLNDYLRQDLSNDQMEVIKLQLFLTQQGFATPITGIYDALTEANVRLFQSAHTEEVLQPWFDIGEAPNLNPTGYVFKTTRWKINDIVCPGIEDFPDLP